MVNRQKRSGKSASKKQTKARKPKRAGASKPRHAKKSKKSTVSKGKGSRKTKQSRKTSDYNLYMKQALSQVKTENPSLTQSEAFKKAAQQWSSSSENPKNQ